MIDRIFVNELIDAFKMLEREQFHNIKVLLYDEEEEDQIYQIRIWHGIEKLSDTYALECKARKSDVRKVGVEKFMTAMYIDFRLLSFMKVLLGEG